MARGGAPPDRTRVPRKLRKMLHGRTSSGGRRWMILPTLLLVVASGWFAPAPAAAGSVHPSLVHPVANGGKLVGDAEASLARGQGPAHGSALTCTNAPSSTCGISARPHPLVGPAANWTNETNVTAPSPRELVSLTYDAADAYVLLFGGGDFGSSTANAETWTYQAGTWTKLSPSTSPGARMGGAMAYDTADSYVVLFGGYSGSGFYGDTWTYSAGTWTQVSPSTSPSGRWGMGMVYDAADGYVLLFGGEGGFASYKNDTWEYLAGTWTQLSISHRPSVRGDINMAYDSTDHEVVLFSGEAGGAAINDTWTYLGGTWTDVTSLSTFRPTAASGAFLADDPSLKGVVIEEVVSSTGGPTYLFANDSWSSLSTTQRPPGATHTLGTWDDADRYVVTFGGEATGFGPETNYTWALRLAATVVHLSLTPTQIDLHQSTTIRVAVQPVVAGVSIRYSGLPAGCATANVTLLVCDPTVTGAYPINASATTPQGNVTSSANVTLIVHPAPALAGLNLTPSAVTAGRPELLAASGLTGDPPFAFTYVGVPTGCASVNMSSYTCSPTVTGTFPITLFVNDSRHDGARASATLHVNPHLVLANLLVTPTSSPDLHETIQIGAAPSGGTPPVTYTFSGLPPGCLPVNSSNLACAPTSTGYYNVTLTAVDSSGAMTSQKNEIVVSADPLVGPLLVTPNAIDIGSGASFSANFTGGTSPYTVSYSGLPPGCSEGGQLSLSCVPSRTGNFEVTISVKDADGFTTNATTNLTVNGLPHLTSVSYPTAGWDVGVPFTIAANATGGTGALSFQIFTAGTGGGGCANPVAPNITVCNETRIGNFQFRIVASDTAGRNASLSGVIYIRSPPTITGFLPFPAQAQVGETVNLSFTVSGGTSPFHFVLKGFPADCALLGPTPGYECQPLQAGTFTVNLTVVDEAGASSSASALVVISPAPGVLTGSSSPLSTTDLVLIALAVVAVIAVAVYAMRGRGGPPSVGAPAPPPPPPPSDEPREMELIGPPE